MNLTGAAFNGRHMRTPLDSANVVYDELAARLKFQRQPGTRERLQDYAGALLFGSDSERHLCHFDKSHREALQAVVQIEGAEMVARQLIAATTNHANSKCLVNGVLFDFWEQE